MGLERLLKHELELDGAITHCKDLTGAGNLMKAGQRPLDLVLAGQTLSCTDEIREFLALSREMFGYEIPVLVYSDLDEQTYAPIVLAAGAVGFVRKSAWFPTLIAAIDTAIKGGYFVGGRPLLRQADREALVNLRNNPLCTLSVQELKIGEFLAKKHTCQAISKALSVHRSTVSTYRRRIFKKFKVTNTREFAQLWNGFQSHDGPHASPATSELLTFPVSHPEVARENAGLLLRNVHGTVDGPKSIEKFKSRFQVSVDRK